MAVIGAEALAGIAYLAFLRRRSRYSSQPVMKNNGMHSALMVRMIRPTRPK